MATYDGLLKRTNGKERPFILTRSFFAGTHKYAAMWSGDCRADWEHYNLGVPILLQSSVCGMSFIGSDVPGFFNNPPDDEFVIRTYQAGSLFPFFRAHAHHDAKRREPWTFDKLVCDRIRNSIQLRYMLLP
jgi:mannosyl-oligosaccharide alpha-1,3-glucosidase